MRICLSAILFISFAVVSAQKNISYRGNLQYPYILNDIWGHTDELGREYALVGTTHGTSIVNVTNPTNPQELFFIPGDTSIWRDIKTWDIFAYETNETGGGLLIIDLNFLPDSIHFQRVTILGAYDFFTAHNLYIDENGVAYLFGSNVLNKGALMVDVNVPNKFFPQLIGIYDDRYVHDGFVRGDTMWTSEIFDGDFSVVDVSSKMNPVVMARSQTSGRLTHNCWLSDDGNYLITTDEIPGGAIDIYDVSNLNNVSRLDSYRSNPVDSATPHNTFFLGEYIFTAYYRDGVTLVDAHKKDNLVEVGFYDTSPLKGPGFEGAWGVYPYLQSGNILVTDREEGLFVLSPQYTRAAYLEGTVTDNQIGFPINNMNVEIMATRYLKRTIFNGNYKTGVADEGTYDVRFYHPNCRTVIVSGVELTEGEVTILNVSTDCDFTVSVFSEKWGQNSSIFPNPAENQLVFTNYSNKKLSDFHISDMSGRKVTISFVQQNDEVIFDLSNFQSGVYVLRVVADNEIFVHKFIRK